MQCINDQTKDTDVNYIIGDLFEITCASPQQENVCKKNKPPKKIFIQKKSSILSIFIYLQIFNFFWSKTTFRFYSGVEDDIHLLKIILYCCPSLCMSRLYSDLTYTLQFTLEN